MTQPKFDIGEKVYLTGIVKRITIAEDNTVTYVVEFTEPDHKSNLALTSSTLVKIIDEPFMNKPCVAHQICHEDKIKLLNEIQTDIEIERAFQRSVEGFDTAAGLHKASKIIEKYKSEEDSYDEQTE